MAKKRWDDVVKKALEMFLHRDQYAYLYGAKGAVITNRAQFDSYVKAEPQYFKKYSAAQLTLIYQYCLGRKCFDCSGFIGEITGCKTSSTYQFKECTAKKTDVYQGVAGSLLHLPGHIGIDIGYGYYLHMPSELKSVELGRLKENTCKWTETGMLTNYIDYTGASER